MAAAVYQLEIRLGDPLPDESCYETSSPFDVEHAGKLVTHPLYLRSPAAPLPPRNHCLVSQGKGGEPRLLRFTPLWDNHLTSLGLVTHSLDVAAELHQRHLEKLGEVGLHPWFTDLGTGGRSLSHDAGIFILQDLLPSDADVGLSRDSDCELMEIRLSRYLSWARANNEPCYLYDIDEADQYSRVGPDIVLHDVEPNYISGRP